MCILFMMVEVTQIVKQFVLGQEIQNNRHFGTTL